MRKIFLMVVIVMALAAPIQAKDLTLEFALLDYKTAMAKVELYKAEIHTPFAELSEKDQIAVIHVLRKANVAAEHLINVMKAKGLMKGDEL